MRKLYRSGLEGFVVLFIAAAIVGCNSSHGPDGAAQGPPPAASSLYAPIGDTPVVPFPNDLLFVDGGNLSGAVPGLSADGTLNVPDPNGSSMLIADLNRMDGFSTTDNLYTDFKGAAISVNSANNGGVRVVDLADGTALDAGTDFDVVASPDSVDNTRLLIRPLKPLAPNTSYAVIVTHQLTTTAGDAVAPSDQFNIVSSPDAVGSSANPASSFTSGDRARLDRIRAGTVRPLLAAVQAKAADVVVAWQFTTQSIGDSLRAIAANPTPNPDSAADGGIRVQPLPDGQGGQLSTGKVNPGLPDTANLYQGTVDLSYYLADNSDGASPPAPLTTFWQNNGEVVAEADSTLRAPDGSPVPCAAVTASESTTGCYPIPTAQSVQSVPVLVAVPNANSPSGGTPPAGGWPVVIFQHGITADRTNIFAVAPALAAAGFVTVAIDLPLHGLAPDNPLAISGAERTFDLDANGDGVVDASGANFINLQSPITARDNNREAVADLIDLNATLRQGTISVAGGNPIALNGQPSQYFGHSLGAIVGGILMGVTDDKTFAAATLANPGGGVIRLLDASPSFGPIIAQGLAAAGVAEGSEDYQTFLRTSQTIQDSGDPINYAAAAVANHPLHMIEVVGGGNGGSNPPDLVVPNSIVANVGPDFTPGTKGACPATGNYTPFLDTVCVGAPLSGTDPLATAMGLNSVAASVPFASGTAPANSVIRFASGTHSTVLDPTAGTDNGSVDPQEGAATNAEMQCEAAGFLAASAAGQASPAIPLGCQ